MKTVNIKNLSGPQGKYFIFIIPQSILIAISFYQGISIQSFMIPSVLCAYSYFSLKDFLYGEVMKIGGAAIGIDRKGERLLIVLTVILMIFASYSLVLFCYGGVSCQPIF